MRQITAIRERMSAAAGLLGAEIIDRERALDRLFVQSQITPEALKAETAAIGELQGRLRAAHLATHLDTRASRRSRSLSISIFADTPIRPCRNITITDERPSSSNCAGSFPYGSHNSGGPLTLLRERCRRRPMAELGQEEPFSPRRLSGGEGSTAAVWGRPRERRFLALTGSAGHP